MTKKKTKGKQSDYIQHRVGVYATESDLKDDTVVFLAVQCGILTPNDYDIVDVGTDEKPEKKIVVKDYSEKAIQAILKNLFGFRDGWYEVEVVEKQRTRFGNKIVYNEKRYTGLEREDKDWTSSSMCSDEMKSCLVFGSRGEV